MSRSDPVMRAVAVTDVGKLEFVELPMPQLRGYECLVRMRACGLCNGTDLRVIDGTLGNVREKYPVILGHEGVGEIVEVGEKVRNFAFGDIITDPATAVEHPGYRSDCAAFCEYGIMQDLEVMRELGLGQDAVRFLARRACVVRADMAFEDAAMLVTFKETYSAVRNFGVQPGMDVLIFGDGPNSLSLAFFTRHVGAGTITVVGHWDERLERFTRVAKVDRVINSNERPVREVVGDSRFDLVIDAVGSTATIREGLPFVKPCGKLGAFGVLRNTDDDLPIRAIPNGVCLQMLQWPVCANDVHDEVVAMVQDGSIDPKAFYSEVDSWENIEDAVRRVRSREALKIILTI
jgi:L-iditol 2-dehydrogenase